MNIAVYRKDLKDGSAGKSNHTGIIVDTNVDKKTEEAVIAHETVHQHQQRNGELDYDKENFYWKGKTYPRENLNEHNENLPWEKEAYAKSNGILNGKQEDMKERFQLKGYRGNNKPFKTMSDRGLIGAQSDGASAEMCGIGGGDDPTKCKGSTKAYDKVQGKKRKTKRVKNPKNKESKFVYTTDTQHINRAPKTIENQPEWDVEHNTWDSSGKIKPTINTPGGSENVSDETKKEISTRSKNSQEFINKGVDKNMGGEGQTSSESGSKGGIYEGSRYKKVKRKNSSGNKVTKFKHKSSYTLDKSDPDGKQTLTYTKGKNRVKTISSDSKRFDKKVKRVTGKTRKNAAPKGSGDKFVSKRSKMII
jgi:hypothetical protein